VRAPGVRLDPGGIAKGMAADLAAASLPAGVRYAISCGGDLAVGGERPWDVAVRSARSEAEVHRLRVRSGGIATSGIGARIWQTEDGRYAHHVIDPATGRPAWTGLVAVTAVAGNALEAEVLAKAALLSGPLGARRLLRRRGGVLQHDDGRVEIVPAPAVVRLLAPARHLVPSGGRTRSRRREPARLSVLAREPLGRHRRLPAAQRLGDPRPRDVDAARTGGATCGSCTSGSRCWRSARWPPTGCCCSRTAGCSRGSPRS
jgi:hypothetical protein